MSDTPPPPPPGQGGGPPPPPPAGGGAGGGFTAGGGAVQPGSGGSGGSLDLGAAFTFGWERFKENVGPILIGMVGLLVIVGVIGFVWFALVGTVMGTGSDAGFFLGLVGTAIGSLVYLVGAFFIQAVFVRAGLDLVDGKGLETSRLFSTEKIGPILVASLLVGLGTTIGYMLCYIPGLVFQFAAAFTLFLVIDEDVAPMDAIRGSIEIFRNNIGSALLLVFVTGLVAGAGAILCGVGMLVTAPVALIAQAHGYRQLRGQRIAAA